MRLLRRLALVLCVQAAIAPHAAAQDYPDRPVRLVVGFSPGGGSDLVARILAKALGKTLGQAVVVENRPGAGGMIATRAVAAEKPDGYTLLLGSAAAFVINPYLRDDVGYDAVHDFTPVGAVSRFDYVLLGRPGLPAATLADLLAHARAHPGELTIGSAGVGSNTHLVALAFLARGGIELRHVPYKGTAGALNDLLGGNIDLLFDSVPTVMQQVKARAAVSFATTGAAREATLPAVPTFAQAGMDGFEASNWFAVFGPRGLPAAVVERLNAGMARALRDPELLASFEQSGNIALGGSPADLAALVARETRQYKTLIDATGVRLD
ncbi:Bug family tripartite tricarboxylate transporter substrate binding protein [Bordetella petrii]|uniref:Bug family tripartite tricarboxylate transporter substrate binding protein n=1 Tax=Bordetella petrii TaxID=94624 RepID=UPI0004B632AB|nr:tripartite tricarboxylate transporter substrate binding protein [Bordetella petrii]